MMTQEDFVIATILLLIAAVLAYTIVWTVKHAYWLITDPTYRKQLFCRHLWDKSGLVV